MGSMPPKSEFDIVGTAALEALAEVNGDQARAAKLLEERATDDVELKLALIEPLLGRACSEAVGRRIREQRQRVWNPPRGTHRIIDRAAALERVAATMLLQFPLPGGMMLGEATRAEVAAAAHAYEAQASDMAHKGRWLQLIGQSLPEGKVVREVLSEARLSELQAEAAR